MPPLPRVGPLRCKQFGGRPKEIGARLTASLNPLEIPTEIWFTPSCIASRAMIPTRVIGMPVPESRRFAEPSPRKEKPLCNVCFLGNHNPEFAAFHAMQHLSRLAVPLLAALLLLTGCPAGTTDLVNDQTRFELRLGNVLFLARIAATPEQQSKGLMHLVTLPENEGMLFVFNQPDRRSFWMKNTHLPLDIGFFDSKGILREVFPLIPYEERPVRSTDSDILLALEMNRGWFENHALEPGARLDLSSLNRALVALGHAPITQKK